MLCNIWVEDTFSGTVHQVGTDPHDSLMLLEGAVHYENLQNGGTLGGEYKFIEAPELEGYEIVTPDILRINRNLIHRDLLRKLEEADNEF